MLLYALLAARHVTKRSIRLLAVAWLDSYQLSFNLPLHALLQMHVGRCNTNVELPRQQLYSCYGWYIYQHKAASGRVPCLTQTTTVKSPKPYS